MAGWWRRGTLDRGEAERLLAGASTDPAHAGLADLLRAASAPARPGELAGEDAALAAFRRAYQDPTVPAAGSVPNRARSRRRVGILVGATAAALVLGGTAAAAGTGRLPDPLQRAVHDVIPAVPGPAAAQPTPTASPTDPVSTIPTPSPAPAPGASGASGDAGGSGEPQRLCRAWEKARDDPQHFPMAPADLQALAAAAGGADRIADYCAAGPGAPASPGHKVTTPPGKPDNTGKPDKTRKPTPTHP